MHIEMLSKNDAHLGDIELRIDNDYVIKVYRGMSLVLLKDSEIIKQASFSGYLNLRRKNFIDYSVNVVSYIIRSALVSLLIRYDRSDEPLTEENLRCVDKFVECVLTCVKDKCISSEELHTLSTDILNVSKYTFLKSRDVEVYDIEIKLMDNELWVLIDNLKIKICDDMKYFLLLKSAMQYNVDFCVIENILLYSAYIMFEGKIPSKLLGQIEHTGGRRLPH